MGNNGPDPDRWKREAPWLKRLRGLNPPVLAGPSGPWQGSARIPTKPPPLLDNDFAKIFQDLSISPVVIRRGQREKRATAMPAREPKTRRKHRNALHDNGQGHPASEAAKTPLEGISAREAAKLFADMAAYHEDLAKAGTAWTALDSTQRQGLADQIFQRASRR